MSVFDQSRPDLMQELMDLREREMRLSLALESMPVGVVLVEGEQISVNGAVENITGCDREELRTLDDWFRLCADAQGMTRDDHEAERERGFPSESIALVRHRDGSQRVVELRCAVIDGGEVWVLTDVTDRETSTATRREILTGLGHVSADRGRGIRVLLVERSALMRKLIENILAGLNCEVDSFSEGEPALERFRSGDCDLVLTCLEMSKMDGASLAQAIRNLQFGTGKHTPLIGLTSSTARSDRVKCLRAGMSDLLQKSRGVEVMTAALTHWVRNCLGESDVRRLNVLVAEDVRVNRKIILRTLEKLGHEGHAFPNGREALDAFAVSPCDVILTDLQMPEMDGYALAAEVRRCEGNDRHTPIIALTANEEETCVKQLREHGFDDFLSKTANPTEFEATLRQWGGAYNESEEPVRGRPESQERSGR